MNDRVTTDARTVPAQSPALEEIKTRYSIVRVVGRSSYALLEANFEGGQGAGVFALQIAALQMFVHAFDVLLASIAELKQLLARVQIVFELEIRANEDEGRGKCA